jgi:RhoGAP domain
MGVGASRVCSSVTGYDKVELLEQRLREQDDIVSQLRKEATDKAVRESHLKTQLLKMREDLSQKTEEYQDILAKQTTSEAEQQKLEADLTSMKERVVATATELSQVSSDKLAKEQDVEEAQGAISTLQEKLRSMSRTAEARQKRVEELERKHAEQEQKLREADEELQRSRSESILLREELDKERDISTRRKSQVDTLQRDMQHRLTQAAMLELEKQEREKELERERQAKEELARDLNDKLVKKERRATLMEAKHRETLSQLDLLALQQQELQERVTELQAEVEAKRIVEEKYEELQKKLAEAEAAAADAPLTPRENTRALQEAKSGHFGLKLSKYACQPLYGYTAEIPSVLVLIHRHFVNKNGLRTEGVFRLQPSQKDLKAVKALVNRGETDFNTDAIVMARLLGMWFSELPTPILAGIKDKKILNADSAESAWSAFNKVKEPNRSIALWTLDVLVRVASHDDENKMGINNLANVWAPNLFPSEVSPNMSQSAMNKLMLLVKQQIEFLKLLLQYRQGHPEDM